MEIVQQVAAQFHARNKSIGLAFTLQSLVGMAYQIVIPDNLCKYLLHNLVVVSCDSTLHTFAAGMPLQWRKFHPLPFKTSSEWLRQRDLCYGALHNLAVITYGSTFHTSYFTLQSSASKFRLIVAANDTASSLSSSISSWISRRVSAKSKFSSSSSGATPT